MAAVYAGIVFSPADSEIVGLAGRFLSVLWLISLTLVGFRVSDELIHRYASKLSAALPLTSLTQNIARGSILAIGALMVLNNLGVSITPMLAALGVGGLAVALALQDTLSNLFAGVYITIARQIRMGDYVKLDSGDEGHVMDIAWRNTRLKTLSNNWVVIPNTKLAQAIVTNFDLPSPELAVLVEVVVDYKSDLKEVERVTVEVGTQVMREVSGGILQFEPFIRYHTFGEVGVQFTVILRGKTFVDQYLIKHEFIKRLHQRYAKEGILIPTPIRGVFMERADSSSGSGGN